MEEKEFDMNLIQELQQTSNWKDFEDWYKNKYMSLGNSHVNNVLFDHKVKHQHFDEWKGVFEKYLLDRGHSLYQDSKGLYQLDSLPTTRCEDSFEDLLKWYFNEKQY